MRRFAALAVVAALAAGEFTCKKGAYEGTEILSIENVDDVEACQEYCKGIDGCASLTVAEGGSCVLYGRTAVLDADRKGQSCTQVAALLFECAAGKAFAGGVLTIGDIVTLDECKQQCASFAGVCQGVNYGSDQTCELVDSVDTYAETTDDRMTSCAVSSTSAAAATPRVSTFRCSGSASLEGDEILAFAGSSSVDECSASCEEVPGCNGFAVTSEECQLKSGRVTLAKAAGGRSPAVACVREGSAAEVPAVSGGADKYACSAGSVSYAGGDLLVAVGVKDSDECARLCSAHPDCALYVVSAKACTLKRDTAELVPNDSSAKSRFPVAGTACVRIDAVRVSPPSSSTDPFAGFGAVVDLQGAGGDLKLDVSAQFDCVDDAIFGGEVLGEFSVESVNECLTRCLIDANCDGAAMAADGKACKLGKHVATDTGAGETVCKKKTEEVAGYRCERSRAYAGATVATVGDVASVTACSSLCDAKPGCVIVVYNPETHLCLLKALHAAPLSATLESSTSCVSEKMTVQHGYHCSSAVSLPGGTLSLLSDMTLATCADQCERMVECATVQYTAASSSCELKSLDVRGVEMGAAGVVTCGKPSDPAARGDSSSRTASVLAADGAASLVAWVKLRFGLHVRGLDQAVFQVVPIANDTTFDDDVATLWFTVHVRVPVGMSPSSYGWAAFYAAANELNSANNIFQQSLNPILAAAGLAPLAPGPNGGWSLSHGGAEWLPAVLDSVEIPLVFKPLAGVDFLSDVERLALARYVATSLGFPASSVSTSAVYFCEDDAASTCSLEWRAAQADTAGGANALSSGAPATVKVRLVIDLPENATFSELCQNVSAVLCNETVLNETFYSTRFGLISCGDCDGGDGGEGEAPVDASDLMSTVSRRLLQVHTPSPTHRARPVELLRHSC
ncbi:hypothetical protein DIPPA_20050 [Diplonema papillatum]|nr:hypothetical protein DIPPA_20050 [Diplonema papillatum]